MEPQKTWKEQFWYLAHEWRTAPSPEFIASDAKKLVDFIETTIAEEREKVLAELAYAVETQLGTGQEDLVLISKIRLMAALKDN